MSIPFAKIFESPKHGKILVIKGANDDGDPAVIVSVMSDSIALCSSSICFEDNDEGRNDRDTTFDMMTKQSAEEVVDNISSTPSRLTDGEP